MSKQDTSNILDAIKLSRGVINLAGGTPLFLIGEYLQRIDNKELFYYKYYEYPVYTQGLRELREKIARELAKELRINISSDQILVTAGSTAGLYAVFKTLLKNDDEIIVFSPHWSLYSKQINQTGAKMVEVLLDENQGWDINFKRLDKAINEKTKCILLTNPSSPMGTVISKKSIFRLLSKLESSKIYLILDETYRNIFYDNNINFVLSLKFRVNHPRIVLLRSFSKELSISGLRLGYVYNNSELINKISSVHLAMNMTASVLSQVIGLKLLRFKKPIEDKIKKEYTKRCKIIASFLDQWSSIFSYTKPSAGFFIFPKYNLNLSSIDLFKVLINNYKVAIRPGSEFGLGGEHHIRISFSYPINYIQSGLERIDKFLNTYKK